jgi:hypothetical protein
MESVPEKYRNFDKFIEPLKQIKPEETIHEIRNDVAAFVERDFKVESGQSILIIEKKAKLLFQPCFDRFIEKKFSPAFVRNCHDVTWTKGIISEHYSLLADTINTGAEVINTIANMKVRGCSVDKIYCYILNSEAVANLSANPLTANIPIVSAHKIQSHVGDPLDYVEKLKILYVSLPDPMDIDHAYDIYRGDCSLTPHDFRSIIENSCKKTLNLVMASFRKDEKVILPNGIESFRMNIDDPRLINIPSNPKIKNLANTIMFDYANLKLKTFFKKGDLQFLLIACFPVNNLRRKNVKPKNGCDICTKEQCYHALIFSRISKVLFWKTFCPLCVENYLERKILNEIQLSILTALNGNGKLVVEKYDPFDREL